MPSLSEEQLVDISLAYSNDEILEILGIEPIDLVYILKGDIEDNLLKFNLRPVDCDSYDV